jgi:hypothetical protein
MIYSTEERNNTIRLIAEGKADFKNVALYERLQEFHWITIKRANGIINTVELTYAGNDLYKRLLKNK